jgi:hypothetical protein
VDRGAGRHLRGTGIRFDDVPEHTTGTKTLTLSVSDNHAPPSTTVASVPVTFVAVPGDGGTGGSP